jgi:CheY-like chemotaxis protein
MTPPNSNENFKLLLVDDNALIRESIALALEMIAIEPNLQLEILEAESGAEALEILRGELRNQIKAVVTDLNMPGMNGVELLKQLMQEGWQGKTAMLTGNRPEAEEKLKAAGISTEVFSKPLDWEKAEEILRSFGVEI